MSDEQQLVPADLESRVTALEGEMSELRGLFAKLHVRVSDIAERLVLVNERQEESERLHRSNERKISRILEILECKTCKRHKAYKAKRTI